MKNNENQESNNRTIGYLSKKLGISTTTIRLYEQKYSLPIKRNSSNYRVYSDPDIEIYELIVKMEKDGIEERLILKTIQEKLSLSSKEFKDSNIENSRVNDEKFEDLLEQLNSISEDKIDQLIDYMLGIKEIKIIKKKIMNS